MMLTDGEVTNDEQRRRAYERLLQLLDRAIADEQAYHDHRMTGNITDPIKLDEWRVEDRRLWQAKAWWSDVHLAPEDSIHMLDGAISRYDTTQETSELWRLIDDHASAVARVASNNASEFYEDREHLEALKEVHVTQQALNDYMKEHEL